MSETSHSHLVLIPSYNTGMKLLDTVRDARAVWQPVWVVVDGSNDGTTAPLQAMAESDPGLRVIVLEHNQGKGAAVLRGLHEALAAGFTHVLTMDADGQHPAGKIPEFMAASAANPRTLILGMPIFDASAPLVRVHGRKIANALTNLETLWQGIGDSLYGFRIYPAAPLRDIMGRCRWMRRFDFDPEAATRLCWYGLDTLNIVAPVRYFRPDEGGVSHFNYLRDNALLTWMHTRLLLEFVLRLPAMLRKKFAGPQQLVRSSRR